MTIAMTQMPLPPPLLSPPAVAAARITSCKKVDKENQRHPGSQRKLLTGNGNEMCKELEIVEIPRENGIDMGNDCE